MGFMGLWNRENSWYLLRTYYVLNTAPIYLYVIDYWILISVWSMNIMQLEGILVDIGDIRQSNPKPIHINTIFMQTIT